MRVHTKQLDASGAGAGALLYYGTSAWTPTSGLVWDAVNSRLGTANGTAAQTAIGPSGDPNTGPFFPAADTMSLSIGGEEHLRMQKVGGAASLTWSSDGVVGTTLRGIANGVNWTANQNAAFFNRTVLEGGTAVGASPWLQTIRVRGTVDVPTTLASGDQIGVLAMAGQAGSGVGSIISGFEIQTFTTQAWTAAVQGTRVDFLSRLTGSGALTSRLSFDGAGIGTLTAALRYADGTAAVPSMSFTNSPTSGLFRAGADNPAMSIAGVQHTAWSATGAITNYTRNGLLERQWLNPNAGAAAWSALTVGQTPGGSGNQYVSLQYFNSGSTLGGTATANTARLVVDDGGDGGLQIMALDANAPIALYTGGALAANERVRITGTGLVGIGTSTPSTRLHVHQATGDTQATISNPSSAGSAGLLVSADGAGFDFTSFGSAYVGNVGLDPIPLADLAVFSTGVTLAPANLVLGAFGTTPLHLMTVGLVRMSIKTSGEVVVGPNSYAATPGATLDVRGAVLGQRKVVPRTTATSPTAADSRTVYTNEGAGAQLAVTLPAAVAGLSYTFICQDNDGIQITAAAGDNIIIGIGISSAGGTATSSAIGDNITLVAVNNTEWHAVSYVGSWVLA